MIAGGTTGVPPSTRVFDLHLSSVRGGKAKAEKQVRLTSLRVSSSLAQDDKL
jgi:hypothetical protein